MTGGASAKTGAKQRAGEARGQAAVVVAGHICLDVIPAIPSGAPGVAELFCPGRLIEVGKATIATGGAVSNTGLALHRLGVPAKLMGKVGDDLWGGAILDILRAHDPELASGMIVVPGEATSYTVVLSPPGHDRIFLHAPGANDTFSLGDIPLDQVPAGGIFHFGYPPLMARMYRDGGDELAAIFCRAKEAGAVTSLDMAMPDPGAPSGRAPWRTILAKVLPYVDIFLPSAEETLLMLDPERYRALSHEAQARGEPLSRRLSGSLASELAGELLEMGGKIIGLKAGDQGLYLRTAARERFEALAAGPERTGALSAQRAVMGPASGRPAGGDPERVRLVAGGVVLDPGVWSQRELWIPCFAVDVVGTTGSGDATVAGFLAAVLQGKGPKEALEFAVAVGAFSVEAPDATSGIATAAQVNARLARGWPRRPLDVDLAGWREPAGPGPGVWVGPHDRCFQG